MRTFIPDVGWPSKDSITPLTELVCPGFWIGDVIEPGGL
jgi:hypothetical protein